MTLDDYITQIEDALHPTSLLRLRGLASEDADLSDEDRQVVYARVEEDLAKFQ